MLVPGQLCFEPHLAQQALYSVLMTSTLLHGVLRDYRQSRATRDSTPLYCIFGDTVLKAIAQSRPTTREALQAIPGFTDDKYAQYGEEILRLVRGTKPELKRPPRSTVPPVVVKFTGGSKARQRAFAPFPKKPRSAMVPSVSVGKNEGVYILELAEGRVYVGYSTDMRKRVQQHMAGQGSAYTRAFPPTGVVLPRLGCVSGSPEAAERDETLRYMFLRGIQAVRGWRYVRVEMSDADVDEAETNIRELYDLCRRCGHPGHFITQCRNSFDRLGRPCERK